MLVGCGGRGKDGVLREPTVGRRRKELCSGPKA